MAPLHRWDVSPAEARAIQQRLRARVSRRNSLRWDLLQFVAGVDVSVRDDVSRAAVVVLDFAEMTVVETATAEQPTPFPYVPGLLSFRECPVVCAAFAKLAVTPQAALVDGAGIAHPRRIGLASHLGLLWDLPTVGCAKTRFIGTYDEPHETAGHYADLIDDGQLSKRPGELIGGVLRTRDRVKPLFVSIGHRIDLPTALDLVLACCRGYRLPEPTRLAHQAAGRK
ncbi:MAG: deoxyribonuclease V [Planctomycetaceae bacterium]|nr:deoxyribonuclease V [Planctomycetaceae bacterium]